MSLSIILTIFNKDPILEKILTGLFKTTSSTVHEYIFVLDGCTDRSETIVKQMVSLIPQGVTYKLLYAANVFEIRANNIGLRACTNDYAILVQDDMLLMEDGWNDRLMQPMLAYSDLWAVTARTSCALNPKNKEWENIQEGPVGHRYKQFAFPRDKFYVGQVINRGPLLVKMDVMRKLNYFDETLPGCIGCDDVDFCLRAFKELGLRCGSFWIGYYSPLAWGSTRTGANRAYTDTQQALNLQAVLERHRSLLEEWKYDEVRTLCQS